METKLNSETVGVVDNIMKYKSYGFIAMYNKDNNFEKEKILFFHLLLLLCIQSQIEKPHSFLLTP